MKIKFNISTLPIIFSLLFTISIPAQWIEINPIPDPIPGQNYASVYFVDSQNGWIVGNRGVILHTTDGGNHWIQQESGINSSINKIKFSNSMIGWAIADLGKILHSSDGGNTWNIQYDGDSLWNMKHISAVDEFNVWVVGNSSNESTHIFLHTANGGANWDTLGLNLYPSEHVSDIFFFDANIGWYCTQRCYLCSGGNIYKTLNGGQDWFWQKYFGSTEIAKSIFFTDINHGWCAGLRFLYYTTNGGSIWISTGNSDQHWLTDVYFNDDHIGWLVEQIYNGSYVGSDINFTSNHGQSMVHQYSTPYNFFIYDLCFIEQRIGWAVVSTNGEDAFLVHTTNGGGVFPSPPSLIFPIDGSAVNIDTVNFSWSGASPNVTGYNLTLSSDSLFYTSIDTLVTTTSLRILNLLPNQKYFWKVKALNSLGYGAYSNPNSFITNLTSIEEDRISIKFNLDQNYPNPFNPSTNIKYAISSRQFVTLKVFDVLGNEIAVLVNEEKSSGSYEVNFSATGGASKLSSGVYYYQLRAGEFVETKKMIYLK